MFDTVACVVFLVSTGTFSVNITRNSLFYASKVKLISLGADGDLNGCCGVVGDQICEAGYPYSGGVPSRK